MRFFPSMTRKETASKTCRTLPRLDLLEDRYLLSAGVLDPTFGNGGIATAALSGTEQGADTAIYPKGSSNAGKIVVVGTSRPSGNSWDSLSEVMRLNANGTLDSSFNKSGVTTTNFEKNYWESFNAVAIQSDGKIVAGGFSSPNPAGSDPNNDYWTLARFNANGTLDKTFGSGGKVKLDLTPIGDGITDLLIQPDGKIVAVGSNNRVLDQRLVPIARFLENGKLDTTFDGDGIAWVSGDFTGVAIQSDGKLVASGSAVAWIRQDDPLTSSNEYRVFETSAFWRFNPNGSIDTSFGTGGRFLLNLNDGNGDGKVEEDDRSSSLAVQVQTDGTLKFLGLIDDDSNQGVVTIRIDSAGNLDPSYGVNGIARTSNGYLVPNKFFTYTSEGNRNTSMAVEEDGKPVIAIYGQYADLNSDGITYSSTAFSAVLRLSREGVIDDSWATTSQSTGMVSGTGDVSGTLHDSFTFTASTGSVKNGDSISATFTIAKPITVSGTVTGYVTGTFTGSAWLKSSTLTEETWQVDGTGSASGSVTGTITGIIDGNTVTGTVVGPATGTAAAILNNSSGFVIGADSGIFTGRFTSRLSITGSVFGNATGGVVQNLLVSHANNVALQPDGKVLIMGRNADSNDVVLARYSGDNALHAGSPPVVKMAKSIGTLTLKEVQGLIPDVVNHWQNQGIDVYKLEKISFQITSLPGTILGLASGNTIFLDDNAAGWGWFVDPTPWDDSEFILPGDQGEQGRMDLLTVVMHEMGHVLGYEHEDHGVMQPILSPGTRWGIDPHELEGLFAILATEGDEVVK